MVEGIDNAGTPDAPQGEQAAKQVSDWADVALDDLEDAQDALDEEPDTLEEAIEQLPRGAAHRARSRAVSQTVAGVGRTRSRSSRRRSVTRAPVRSCARRSVVSTMDWVLVAVEGLVVIGFIALGVRSGGIGLGLWGGVGTLVLVFVFGLDPGEPPISAILIIIAVISAAAAMQAAGGVDYMVVVASKALRARPKALNFVAPYVSYLLTILTGTSNTFFSIIPVINEVAYANKIRPERALAGSTVANALGITSSPVAAAMATLLPLVEIYHYDLVDVLLITIPASMVGIFAMSLVMSRHGKDLEDDAEYQRRLAAGEVQPPAPAADIVLQPYAKRSVAIFLAGVVAICVFGFVESIRPTVAAEGGGVEPMSVTPLIQMIMLTAAALILVFCHVKATRCPGHGDLQVGHGRDDRSLRDRLDGRHVHRQQRGCDRPGARQPRREVAVHDRGRHLPRRRADDEPVGRDPHDGAARARARDQRRLHDRDVDSRRRRPLPSRQRHADRRRRGRHDRHHNARQARHRPLLPAAAADRLDRHRARRHRHRLALLRRSHPGAAGADDDRAVS